MEDYEWRLHPTNIGDHGHSGSGDIMFLVYHVISQEHVIKGSCDFMNEVPHSKITLVLSLLSLLL